MNSAHGVQLLAAVIAGLAAVAPFVPAFLTAAGPGVFLRLPERQAAAVAVALALAAGSVVLSPDARTAGGFALVALCSAHALSYPHRVLVALDDPPHVRGNALGDRAPVLALHAGDAVVAWPMEVLVPRHIVNDHAGGLAVVAAF